MLQVRYLAQKGNTFYFRRRIPHDVRTLYPSKKGDLYFSLKTSDSQQAAKRAHQEALRQDALWRAARSNEPATGPDLRNAAEGYLESFDLKPGQREAYQQAGLEPDEFYEELIHLSDTPWNANRLATEHLPPHAKLALDMFNGEKIIPCLTDAVSLYCERKGEAGKKNKGARTNAVNALLRLAGDLPIDRYTRQHAHDLIADLRGQGLRNV